MAYVNIDGETPESRPRLDIHERLGTLPSLVVREPEQVLQPNEAVRRFASSDNGLNRIYAATVETLRKNAVDLLPVPAAQEAALSPIFSSYYLRALSRHGLTAEARAIADSLERGFADGLFHGPYGTGKEFMTWTGGLRLRRHLRPQLRAAVCHRRRARRNQSARPRVVVGGGHRVTFGENIMHMPWTTVNSAEFASRVNAGERR